MQVYDTNSALDIAIGCKLFSMDVIPRNTVP